jgi:hypothetical protein
MKRRRVLLHYHYFKNAGSTIEWILEKNFAQAHASLHEDTARGTVVNSEIMEFLLARPQVVSLTSHHIRLPAPSDERFRFIEICCLRHPMDRLLSIYHHYRRETSFNDLAVLQSQTLNLREFLEWFHESQPFNTINPQTNLMSNSGNFFFPPTRRDWQRAVTRTREVKMLGVVERFDDSLIAAEYFLRPMFPKLDLSYIVQNVNPTRMSSLAKRLDEMRYQCGPTLYSRLEEANRFDAELAAIAEDELDRRLQFVPHLSARREVFQSRCLKLQASSSQSEQKAA